MKILMLHPGFPWPLRSGGVIRNYHLIKGIAEAHEITLACMVYDKDVDIGPIRHYCSELHLVPAAYKNRWLTVVQTLFSLKPYGVVKFQSRRFRREVNRLLMHKSFDIIFYCSEGMTYYLNPILSKQALHVLDQHDVDELMWERYAREGNWMVQVFARYNILKEMHFYRKTRRYLDAVFCVSEEHARFMRERVPNYCHVWIAPHGVDIEYFQPTSAWENKSNIIIFCGSMNVTMNVDAALRSAQKIFPIVRNAVPDAEFWIVGRNPDRRVLKIAGLEGITVTGTVEDVKPYYEKAKVAVAPFRYGGGIKVKILEAMAMGVPVVSTDVSCFGLEVTPGKHILTANDDEAFAKQVVLLLKDSSLWKKLSDEGRLLVKQKYVWRSIVEEVVAHLENLVAEKRIGGI